MRLVTRSDFDGLVCATLFKHLGLIDDYLFAHPKDIQDGKVETTKKDILANVPYVPGCGMWFDHHSSEQERLGSDLKFEGMSKPLASCARVIWEYYGPDKFPAGFETMLEAVDRVDSASLTDEEVLNPTGWILLAFIMDPRTGLGRYKGYKVSNYQLMLDMITYCSTLEVNEILENPDVKERVVRYHKQAEQYKAMLLENSVVRGNAVVLDLLKQDPIYSGNRFMVYTLFPECNISLRVMWGFKKQNVVISVGHSTTNRTSRTDVGKLMLAYGGGGHKAVGTCQVAPYEVNITVEEIVQKVNQDG